MRGSVLLVLALACLMGPLCAAGQAPVKQFLDIQFFQWLFGAVALLSVMVILAVKLFSDATANPQLGGWVKVELSSTVSALIFAAAVLALFASSDMLSILLSSGQSDYEGVIGEIDAGLVSMEGRTGEVMDTSILMLHYITLYSGYSFSYVIPLVVVNPYYGSSPFAGFSTFMSSANQAISASVNAMAVLMTMQFLLYYLPFLASRLVYVGLAIRFIPNARGVGTTLVVLCLAAYFIYPLSVGIANYFNDAVDLHEATVSADWLYDHFYKNVGIDKFVCQGPMKLAAGIPDVIWEMLICTPICAFLGGPACYVVCEEIVGWGYAGTVTVGQITVGGIMLNAMLNGNVSYSAVYDKFTPFFRYAGNLVLLVYMDAVLVGLLTITGAKALSSSLGGEMHILGLERLI